jgi:hypothetical protein
MHIPTRTVSGGGPGVVRTISAEMPLFPVLACRHAVNVAVILALALNRNLVHQITITLKETEGAKVVPEKSS